MDKVDPMWPQRDSQKLHPLGMAKAAKLHSKGLPTHGSTGSTQWGMVARWVTWEASLWGTVNRKEAGPHLA